MTKIGTSQNGWTVYSDTSNFTRFEAAGVKFWAANSDVAVIAADFINWYDKNIESINLKVKETPGYDDWSYAVRPIRGQTSGYSNHGSATAWDLNATRHPRGVKGTHTPAERDKLRTKLQEYRGVIRHGEFYTGTVDGMHFEIDDDRTAVNQVATAIRKRNTVQEQENQMDENTKLELTQTGAETMSVPGYTKRSKGDKLSIGYLTLWGGPGLYRVLGKVEQLLRAVGKVQADTTKTVGMLTFDRQTAESNLSALRAEFAAVNGRLDAMTAIMDQHALLITDLTTLLRKTEG